MTQTSGDTLSVASVTVAFNAVRVLPRQLEALLRQSRPPDEIVVIDNASTDGTAEMLAERFPQVTVVRLGDNRGAAGAWAEGLAHAALRRGHDWVWMLDDDSVPGDLTLQLLLEGAKSVHAHDDKLGMVAPLPVHRASGTVYPPQLWRDGWLRAPSQTVATPIWFADLVYASGCLIHRAVVEEIGLPRADFFMDFFDFEYCIRARSRGYRIAVVNRAEFGHEVGVARRVRLPGFQGLWADHAPWREYYMTRNLTYAGWWLYPNFATKRFVIRHLLRHAGGVVLFGKNKVACLLKMVQGFCDGVRARLGVRFRPGR